MLNNKFFKVILAFLFCMVANASLAAPTTAQLEIARDKSLAYLIQQQNGDGSWGNSQGEKVRLTATVLDAFKQHSVSGIVYMRGINWLANAEATTADAQARRMITLTGPGIIVADDTSQLLAQGIDTDNGTLWGPLDEYRYTTLDTALALQAMTVALPNYDTSTSVNYIKGRRNSGAVTSINGSGWGFRDSSLNTREDSRVTPSAQMLLLLQQLGGSHWGQSADRNAAHWLALQQKASGAITDEDDQADVETALAVQALGFAKDVASAAAEVAIAYGTGLDYLIARQNSNGSIADNIYKTALATQAWFNSAQTLTDTDGDGIPDSIEIQIGTNPAIVDTDYLESGNGNNYADDSGGFFFAEILVNQAATLQLDATPGTMSLNNGELPAGMTMNSSNGSLSGTPTTAAHYAFSYRITQADGTGYFGSVLVRVVTPDTDTDNDGIPASYEYAYPEFLSNLNSNDADDDFDGDGLSNLTEYQKGFNPRVINNTLPTVSITYPADGSVMDNQAHILSGSASDVEDGDLSSSINWSSSVDGTLGTSASLEINGLTLGLHTLEASVTDIYGNTVRASNIVTVVFNTAPTVGITSPAGGSSFNLGDLITFTGTATDAEDGDLTSSLSWSSNLDGVIDSGASFTSSTLSIGMHTITATATDSRVLTGSTSITLTVRAEVDTSYTLNYQADSEGVPADTRWNNTTSQCCGYDFSMTRPLITTTPITSYIGITQAYQFDGSNDAYSHMSLGYIHSVGRGDDASFELWIRPSDLNDSDIVLSIGEIYRAGIYFSIGDADNDGVYDDLRFSIKDHSEVSLTADLSELTGDNVTGEFIQIVGVYDKDYSGSTDLVRLYINGSLIDENQSLDTLDEWGAMDGETELADSMYRPSGTTRFEGDIAILRFYEKAMTENEVLGNFAAIAGDVGRPVISVIEPVSGSLFSTSDPIIFSASASSTVGGDISHNIQWFSDMDGFLDTGTSISTTLSTGSHKITASVTDSFGRVSSDTFLLFDDTDGDGIISDYDSDDDNDGMSDSFETLYGLDPLNPADASSDNDGDGEVALAEFHAGTDPTNINSNSHGIPYVHYKLIAGYEGGVSTGLGYSVAI
ncbi:MAG: hypothetical protein GY942_25680, partial [Aestuariibacter sp.]|nr:hypothetical protein [Aestuariibacter sp.]